MTTATISPKRHQSKTQLVYSQLASLAAELGPNGKFPTVVELRTKLGVSLTTLDGALRELEKRGVIYRMQGIGVFVAPERQKTIGLVYAVRQTYGSPFWDMLVDEMRQRAEVGQERFRIYMTHPMPGKEIPLSDDLIDDVGQGHLDGVIFVGDQNPQGVVWLESQKVPIVNFANTIGHYRVTIPREAMVAMGARELSRRGCRRIGLWVPFGSGFRYSHRHHQSDAVDIFQASLESEDLPFREEWVWRLGDVLHKPQEAGSYQEQGHRAVQEVYAGKALEEVPDGIVILNDLMTRGALVAFNELGVQVGEDVAIATQTNKNSTILMGYESVLTRMEVDPGAVARAMFQVLETLMNGEVPIQNPHAIEPIILPPAQEKIDVQPLAVKTRPRPTTAPF